MTVRWAHDDQGWETRVGSGSDHATPGNSRRAGCGNTPQATTWAPHTCGEEACERTGSVTAVSRPAKRGRVQAQRVAN